MLVLQIFSHIINESGRNGIDPLRKTGFSRRAQSTMRHSFCKSLTQARYDIPGFLAINMTGISMPDDEHL